MKVGLFLNPADAPGRSMVQTYRDVLEQAVTGEALGFESVWTVEQHFSASASIVPAPELLLAAIAARTRTLRLGTGVVLLPLSHPVRVAEELAVLDVISDGRVEFGMGRGMDPTHFNGFSVPLSQARDRLVEGLEIIRGLWGQEPFSFTGPFHQIDDLSIAPGPVQRPHPPIHLAANSMETVRLAGELGLPIIVGAHINSLGVIREMLPAYRKEWTEAGHGGERGPISLLIPVFTGGSMARIREEISPGIDRFRSVLREKLVSVLRMAGEQALIQRFEELIDKLSEITFDGMRTDRAVFDTPGHCADRLREIQEEFEVDRLICWFNLGDSMPQDRVLHAMRMFSAEVMPHL